MTNPNNRVLGFLVLFIVLTIIAMAAIIYVRDRQKRLA